MAGEGLSLRPVPSIAIPGGRSPAVAALGGVTAWTCASVSSWAGVPWLALAVGCIFRRSTFDSGGLSCLYDVDDGDGV